MKNKPMVLYIAQSLDGFIADSAGGIDWLQLFENEEGANNYAAFLETIDTIMMGSVTYQQILNFNIPWPYPNISCYVFTRQEMPHDNNVVFVQGSPSLLLEKLCKVESDKKIWLLGGAELIHQCLKENLIDEFILARIPVLLGQGIPLFKGSTPFSRLSLEKCERHGDILMEYYKLYTKK